MNAERLAMLTAKSLDLNHVPGGSGAGLTQMDIAGMMSGLNKCEFDLLRAKYCGELPHSAWAYWFEHLMSQDWDTKPGQIEAFSRSTLYEFIAEPLCGSCKGTKGLMINSQWVECPRCSGQGYRAYSDRSYAQKLGLKRLQEPWVQRLSWARRTLRLWESNALDKMG